MYNIIIHIHSSFHIRDRYIRSLSTIKAVCGLKINTLEQNYAAVLTSNFYCKIVLSLIFLMAKLSKLSALQTHPELCDAFGHHCDNFFVNNSI